MNAVPADEAVADWIGKQSKTSAALDANYTRRRSFVLLGDSWTQVHSRWLFRELQALNPDSEWHDYGVSGAVVQQLPGQVAAAKSDSGCDPSKITDVIIVMGTNNVFWTKLGGFDDITSETAAASFKAVRDCFPRADVHYFPNNSKTMNGGRNRLYRSILDGARQAGCIVHADCLRLLANHLEWYNGDDQEGVQHLSDAGYRAFARRINDAIHHGRMIVNSSYTGGYSDGVNDASGMDQETIPTLWQTSADGLKRIATVTQYYVNLNGSSTAQTVVIRLKGSILPSARNDIFYVGCRNWYKRIAPRTLPFLFLSSVYYVPCCKVNGVFGSLEITTSARQKNLKDDFYFRGPNMTCVNQAFKPGAQFSLELLTSPLLYDIMNYCL